MCGGNEDNQTKQQKEKIEQKQTISFRGRNFGLIRLSIAEVDMRLIAFATETDLKSSGTSSAAESRPGDFRHAAGLNHRPRHTPQLPFLTGVSSHPSYFSRESEASLHRGFVLSGER